MKSIKYYWFKFLVRLNKLDITHYERQLKHVINSYENNLKSMNNELLKSIESNHLSYDMCPACQMGLCSYCTKKDCSCNNNPIDDVTRQIHEKQK